MQSPAFTARRPGPLDFARIRKTPGLSLIGPPELIGLAGAALIALLTIFAYFYFYLPAQARLTSAQVAREQLQALLRSSEKGLETNQTVSERVNEITAGMKDFEANYLSAPATGR